MAEHRTLNPGIAGSSPAVPAKYSEIETILRRWDRAAYMQLHAGEMTAQEIRTVRAVLRAIWREIDELK